MLHSFRIKSAMTFYKTPLKIFNHPPHEPHSESPKGVRPSSLPAQSTHLETNTGDITHGVAPPTETSDEDLILQASHGFIQSRSIHAALLVKLLRL